MKLSIIQHSPSVHPIVLSPRTVRQSKIRERWKGWPAARVVKRMRTAAMA